MLKFYARGDGLVSIPGLRPVVGQVPCYVGREPGSNLPTKDGYSVSEGTPEARRLLKCLSRGDLWAADEPTAAAAGVPFVALKFSTNGWEPKQQ